MVTVPKPAARLTGALVLGACLAWPVSPVPHAADSIPLSGIVRDALGNVLAGVEILVVGPGGRTEPVAAVRSDRRGKFRVDPLLPGTYRVAALKRGYLTFVGTVNTLVEGSVELVMNPTPPPGEPTMTKPPPNASWALRVPRRGILREVDLGATEGPEPVETARWAGVADALEMELDQLFSVGAAVGDDASDGADLDATETRMRLASTLGDRGSLFLHGRREKLEASSSEQPTSASASQRASSVSMGLSYEAGADSILDVRAFYSSRAYERSMEQEALGDSRRQEQLSWGYDANWSKRIDPGNQVAVELDYRDILLSQPGAAAADAFHRPGDLSNRAMSARGSYDRTANARHRLQVALRARLLRWPSSVSGEHPLSGWSLHAQAHDSWAVHGPFSLVYGLGYRQGWVAREASLVVPSFGGVWTQDGWLARALVSYHAVADRGGRDAREADEPHRLRGPVGYEAEVSLPLAPDLSLKGGATYAPIQFDPIGYGRGIDPTDGHPLYLTDGNAAVREERIALVEERAGSRTYLELANGRADGTLAALLPFDSSVPTVSERDLSYRSGRFGVTWPASGTDVRLEYQRVAAELQPADPAESAYEWIELRLKKQMFGLPASGDWRFLVALRLGSVENDGSPDEPAGEGEEQTLEALNRRLSAGVSVTF